MNNSNQLQNEAPDNTKGFKTKIFDFFLYLPEYIWHATKEVTIELLDLMAPIIYFCGVIFLCFWVAKQLFNPNQEMTFQGHKICMMDVEYFGVKSDGKWKIGGSLNCGTSTNESLYKIYSIQQEDLKYPPFNKLEVGTIIATEKNTWSDKPIRSYFNDSIFTRWYESHYNLDHGDNTELAFTIPPATDLKIKKY